MKHVTYTRLADKHINHYLKDKTFTVKPSDHESENNTIAQLHFKTRKHMNKFHRNIDANKGVRISPNDLEDIQIHDGNGFFKSLKKGLNTVIKSPITKGIVKTLTPMASNLAGQAVTAGVTDVTGNPLIGEAAGKVASNLVTTGSRSYTGSGVKRASRGSHVIVGGSMLPLGQGIKQKSNVKLGNGIEAQSMVGITSTSGLEAINSRAERMAHARSFLTRNRLS